MGGKGWTGGRMVSALLPLLPVVLSACTHAQAKTAPDTPPLNMPAPPPREIVAMETEAPPPAVTTEEPARAQPPKPRPAAPRADAPKPEAAPLDSPRPAEETQKPSAPTTLQTTPSYAEGELERAIREALSRASADLSRIDYRALNADAKSQYDTARRFVQQGTRRSARRICCSRRTWRTRPRRSRLSWRRGSNRLPNGRESASHLSRELRAHPFVRGAIRRSGRGTSLAPEEGNCVPSATCGRTNNLPHTLPVLRGGVDRPLPPAFSTESTDVNILRVP